MIYVPCVMLCCVFLRALCLLLCGFLRALCFCCMQADAKLEPSTLPPLLLGLLLLRRFSSAGAASPPPLRQGFLCRRRLPSFTCVCFSSFLRRRRRDMSPLFTCRRDMCLFSCARFSSAAAASLPPLTSHANAL